MIPPNGPQQSIDPAPANLRQLLPSCKGARHYVIQDNNKRDKAYFHLAEYLPLFSEFFCKFPRVEALDTEGTLAMRKWSMFTDLCNRLGPSTLAKLSSSTINDLFMEYGLCTAAVIQHFAQFFKSRSPLESCPIQLQKEPLLSKNGEVRFYPIDASDEKLAERTQHLRFLQAAYQTASYFKEGSSTEYFSKQIQSKKGIQLTKRFPNSDVTDLLPELKKLTGQSDKGYLIGLKSSTERPHAIALYLDKPYHLFDLNYGIAIADNEQNFMLFLANYLTEKYPEYDSFALLEFTEKNIHLNECKIEKT